MASQQVLNLTAVDEALERLLQNMSPPSMRPQIPLASVLWDYDDCVKEVSPGIILTNSNKCQTKMGSAIRLPNGKPVSNREYANIRHTTDIIAQKLVNWIISSNIVAPRFKLTKLAIKGCFKSEYDEAVLELEAQHNLLCLCSAHWKADSMLGQALLRCEDKTVAQIACIVPSSQDPFNTNETHPLEPSCVRDVIPANMTKCTFQLSPGPKLPSALRTQKRSKDGAVPSGWTTHTERQPPAACRVAPTFLSHTEVTSAASAAPLPTNQPLFVNPSGTFMYPCY